MKEEVTRGREAAEALLSGRQYKLLRTENTWDLCDPQGNKVIGTKKRKVRFLQDEVLAMHDHYESPGRISAFESLAPRQYDQVDDFVVGGKQYFLISLRRFWRRNEETEIEFRRTLEGSFTNPRESVSVTVEEEVDELVMTVIWPDAHTPSRVFLERNRQQDEEFDPEKLPRNEEGRCYLHRTFVPHRGDRISITWDW